MDGERSRAAVQGQLRAELASILQLVHLRPVMHTEGSNPAAESASDHEREAREIVHLMCALRAAIGEGGLLVDVRSVEMERSSWRKERERLSAQLVTLQRALDADLGGGERELPAREGGGARSHGCSGGGGSEGG